MIDMPGWSEEDIEEYADILSEMSPEELAEEIERITQIGLLKNGANYVLGTKTLN